MTVSTAGALRPRPDAAVRDGPAPAPWRVELVDEPEGFEALRSEWDALLAASSADEVFLTWEWLHTWWRHLGRRDGRRLALVAVRRDGELAALAPWALGPSRAWHPLPGRSLQLLGTGAVGSDYLDVAFRSGCEERAAAALAGWLADRGEVVELEQLARRRSSARRVARRLQDWGWTAVERPGDVCPYAELAGATWEGYLASLGSSHRQNVRRRLRKLHRAFDVELRRAETEDEAGKAFEVLLELHRRRWRGRGGSDALDDRAIVAFHRDVTRLVARRGWLRLYVLHLDGRPAAALYGFLYRGRFLFYQSGFDPDFARWSVGLVMMGLSIRDAIADGAREYDLLHGDESYKHRWANGQRELGRLEIYPPSAAGTVRRALREARLGAKALVRGGLDRLPGALRRPAEPGGAAG